MRMTMMTCAAVLIAATGYAQDEAARRAATEVAARVPLERPVKNAPYSAETLVEGSQQLADGNRINRKTTGRVYRDGEGRTRREEDRANGALSISITDPVAGFTYSLDVQNRIAWRTPMNTAGAIMNRVETTQADGTKRVELERRQAEVEAMAREVRRQGSEDEQSLKAKIDERQAEVAARGGGRGGGGGFGGAVMPTMRGGQQTPLEHRVIEGVAVEGRKTTTVIPVGQVGNEQPLTIVSEQWRSPDLSILVMTRHSDPRTGESSYRLLNIIRAEPDRSLFMVPADYTVKDTGIRRMLEQSQRK